MGMAVEYVVFGSLMAANLGFGLYFAYRKKDATSAQQVFLGNRTLAVIPLAVSVLASLVSSTGLIAFTAHFYAYGFHLNWTVVAHVILLPVTLQVVIPVFYRLRLTTLFEVGPPSVLSSHSLKGSLRSA